MTTEQRLDSVEQILGAVAATLQTVATLTERNSTAIDRLEVQIDRLEVQTDRLEVQVANNSAAIDRIAKSLEGSVTDLVSMIGQSVEQAERDRQLFIERAEADRAEIRRILDYLFGQQSSNGKSEGA